MPKRNPTGTLFILLIGIFLFVQQTASAQINQAHEIFFKQYADSSNRQFDPANPFYIASWHAMLPEAVELIRSLGDAVGIISVKDEKLLGSNQFVRLEPANNKWKWSGTAEMLLTENGTKRVILSGKSLSGLRSVLQGELAIKLLSEDPLSNSIVVESNGRSVSKLLTFSEIIFIDVQLNAKPEIGIIGYNRSFHGINAVDYSIPGANGRDRVVGVKEQRMEENDLDLFKRVLNSSLSASTVSNHATVISSIIGGAGNSFIDGRGIANAAKFFPSSFANLFPDDASILNNNNVKVQNHSYGTIIQQFYGAEALSYDMQTWQNKDLLHIFSAGNQGNAAASDGQFRNIPGFANLTANFKMAKNIVTVGAIDNKNIIPAESSSGPIYDGRLAPQLIALGPNGTSDAAAMVSGTVAVLQQVYADSNSAVMPPASLIKAILFNTAEDIGREGIDYKTGYGNLNSYQAVKSLQLREFDGASLQQGQQWTKTISVPPNAAQLKLTLAWTDSSSSLNNSKALVNDLDVELIRLSDATIFKPWVLSTAAHADSLIKLPVRKRDSLNTAEQVSIQQPLAGNYQVRVTGTSISTASQAFHISFHVDTLNTFHFTSPQHSSDVNRSENPDLDIRWRTFIADTNLTGNLYISYNAGLNWQLIKANQKIYTNYYRWPIKDTASRARLRMETSFGDFFSKEFVIAQLTRPVVDFLCTDSARLSWPSHIYANAYKIFALVDSPYLKHVFTVSDTFFVVNRQVDPYLVYAVEPVLNNGIPATRSVAQNITLQAVKCFYKTLYYTLLDQNRIDLILELGGLSYIDSIYFEQVDANASFLRTVGQAKVDMLNSVYHQLVNDAPAGNSYWRVRIKLKTGAIVYTDVITVLSSGTSFLVFYPNPANRNATLNYVLKQGTPFDSRLQLFDISGRLLKDFTELPGTVNISGLSSGMVIYKLISKDGQVLETGKILVH